MIGNCWTPRGLFVFHFLKRYINVASVKRFRFSFFSFFRLHSIWAFFLIFVCIKQFFLCHLPRTFAIDLCPMVSIVMWCVGCGFSGKFDGLALRKWRRMRRYNVNRSLIAYRTNEDRRKKYWWNEGRQWPRNSTLVDEKRKQKMLKK